MITHRLLGHEPSLLERTPTLQHLTWRHLTPGLLAPGTLLALHLLRADVLDSPRATSCCPVEHSPRWALCVCCAVLARRGGAENIALLVRTVRPFRASSVAPRARSGPLARGCACHTCART